MNDTTLANEVRAELRQAIAERKAELLAKRVMDYTLEVDCVA